MKFGTSGLRGLSNDLIKTGAVTYTTAFGRYLLQSGKAKTGDPVLIGRDFRQSSPDIEAICEAALAELGFKTFACGTVPTPALALYGLKARAAALMITGSHIPADRNGIKFYVPDGEIDKADEAAITKLAAGILASDERPIGGTTASEDHSERCLDLFRKRNAQLLRDGAFAGLRLGVYQHSTVARDLLTTLLADYGAHVVALGRSEAFVPIDTEAVSGDAMVLLNQWARLHDLDAIVSADGDGDRPLIADETGRPLRGDIIGLATAKFLNAKLVVTPVTSNSGIEALGLTVTRTRVGSPFVIAGMKEAAAGRKDGVMGFEANGGVLIAHAFDVGGYRLDALPTRDSILPILAVLSLASTQKKPLSVVSRSYGLPVAISDRLENYPVEASTALISHLRNSNDNLAVFLRDIGEVISINGMDGIRVLLSGKRMIHFRPSGNAPEMRCYAEAETETGALELLNAGLARLRYWAEST